jgi:tRNA dimethylallyltransferase
LAATRTASRALGYSQIIRYLAGEIDEQAAREETIVATRQFAKRQLTWFRRDSRVTWLDYDDPAIVEKALELINA